MPCTTYCQDHPESPDNHVDNDLSDIPCHLCGRRNAWGTMTGHFCSRACRDEYRMRVRPPCSNCKQQVCNCHDTFFCHDSKPIIGTTFDIIHSKRRYGVELESQNTVVKRKDTIFNAVTDGSISGAEYVSPILQGDEGYQLIKSLCDLKPRVDNRCGFHLHIDVTKLTPQHLYQLAESYKVIEPIIQLTVTENRANNTYCKPLPDTWFGHGLHYFDNAMYNSSKFKQLQKKQHDGISRYFWVNLHSYYYRGTIENRLHEGTFDAKLIRDWINFNLDFVDWIMDTNRVPSHLMEFLFAYPDNHDYVRARILANQPFQLKAFDEQVTKYEDHLDGQQMELLTCCI